MLKKLSIPFLLCILVLVFSEYYFLLEITSQRRAGMLVLTASGVVLSILFFSKIYKKLGRSSR